MASSVHEVPSKFSSRFSDLNKHYQAKVSAQQDASFWCKTDCIVECLRERFVPDADAVGV